MYVLSWPWIGTYKIFFATTEKSSPRNGNKRFLFSISEWFLTIYLTPYNNKQNGLCMSLNKMLLSFLLLAVEICLFELIKWVFLTDYYYIIIIISKCLHFWLLTFSWYKIKRNQSQVSDLLVIATYNNKIHPTIYLHNNKVNFIKKNLQASSIPILLLMTWGNHFRVHTTK